jgi:hypothetical protein
MGKKNFILRTTTEAAVAAMINSEVCMVPDMIQVR